MITVPLVAPRSIVLEADEALDREHPDFDWESYEKTGDLKHCPCKPGGQLTTFQIEPLSVRGWERAISFREQPTSMALEAFALGLISTTNYRVGNPPVEAQWKRHKVGEIWRLTEHCMKANFHPRIYNQVGSRVLEISNLDF